MDEPEARIFAMDIKGLPRIRGDEPGRKHVSHSEGKFAPYTQG